MPLRIAAQVLRGILLTMSSQDDLRELLIERYCTATAALWDHERINKETENAECGDSEKQRTSPPARADPRAIGSSAILGFLPDTDYEVNDNRNVKSQNDDLRRRNMPTYFIDLKRNQAARCDDREVFSPSFAKQQPNSLSEQQRRINKRSCARHFELLRTD
jgi:hypothetical protein